MSLRWTARRVLAGIGVAGAALAAAPAGLTPPVQQVPPQFRATTDLVMLDVSVLDRSRRAIRGLTAADFTILEDGVPQEIAAFSAVEAPTADPPSAKWMGRAPLDIQTNRMPNGRMVLLYLDERLAAANPFAARSTKEVGHAVIDQLAADDIAAVAFALDHTGAQEFTTDRARLHEAVDRYGPAQPAPISILGTLRDLSQLLGAIPERRKVIVYVGTGQAFDTDVLSSMERVTAKTGGTVDTFRRAEQTNQFNALLSLFRVAQRANVTLYTIDPTGLGNNQMSASKEFLRLIAANTGGRAVTGNNVPASQVPVILAENAAYYLITFRSTNPRNEGKFRRVQVKVNRPGVDVRTRRGYVEGQAGPMRQAGVNPALGRLVPATQLNLGLWAVPADAGTDASGTHPIAMMIEVELPREGAPPAERVTVSYAVVDMSGRERATGRQELTVSAAGGGGPTLVAGMQAIASLPPGRYDVRVTAQSIARNRRGGLLGDVIVPDFSKDPIALSGVFIGLGDGAAVRREELTGLLSLTPTTARTFDAAESVVAAVRLFQARTPLAPETLKVTILDGRDKRVVETSHKLAPETFANGAGAMHRLALPVATLGSGQFLLRLEASRSGVPAVRREVRFTVR